MLARWPSNLANMTSVWKSAGEGRAAEWSICKCRPAPDWNIWGGNGSKGNLSLSHVTNKFHFPPPFFVRLDEESIRTVLMSCARSSRTARRSSPFEKLIAQQLLRNKKKKREPGTCEGPALNEGPTWLIKGGRPSSHRPSPENWRLGSTGRGLTNSIWAAQQPNTKASWWPPLLDSIPRPYPLNIKKKKVKEESAADWVTQEYQSDTSRKWWYIRTSVQRQGCQLAAQNRIPGRKENHHRTGLVAHMLQLKQMVTAVRTSSKRLNNDSRSLTSTSPPCSCSERAHVIRLPVDGDAPLLDSRPLWWRSLTFLLATPSAT